MEDKDIVGRAALSILSPGLCFLKIISVENVRSVRKSLYILRVIDMKGGCGFITMYTDHEDDLYMDLSDEIFCDLLTWSDRDNVTYSDFDRMEFMAYCYHYEHEGNTFCSVRPVRRGESLESAMHKSVDIEFEYINRHLLKKMICLH